MILVYAGKLSLIYLTHAVNVIPLRLLHQNGSFVNKVPHDFILAVKQGYEVLRTLYP